MPVVEMEEQEVAELQARVDAFQQQVQQDTQADTGERGTADGETAATGQDGGADAEAVPSEPIRELVLTADELNTLIAADPDFKGKAFVKIEDDRMFGTVSIPTDMIPGGKDRFLNAEVEFTASVQNDELVVNLKEASVKGNPLPAEFMDGLRNANIADEAYNNPEQRAVLKRFEAIDVKDGKVILRLKPVESETSDESSNEADVGETSSEDAAIPTQPSYRKPNPLVT